MVTVEDGIIRGGIGSMIAEALNAAEVDTPLRRMGVANYFPRHASRGEVLEENSLTPEEIAAAVEDWLGTITES